MLQISIVIFRESLEIFLILGLIFAATQGLKHRFASTIIGVLIGSIGSVLLALSASRISESFDGHGQEIFNILLLSVTILMILVTIVWMKGKASQIKTDFKNLEQQNFDERKTQISLIIMISSLFFREGSEIALFLMSIFAVHNFSTTQLFSSSIMGLSYAIILGVGTYIGLFKYAGKKVFRVTSVLLMLIAASLSSEVANLISSANLIEFGSNVFWDSSWLINDDSTLGRFLRILIGYNSRPTILQLMFYCFTLFLAAALDSFESFKRKKNI